MIPHKIHYCWFGGNPLPELAIKCINSWKKFLPNYEIIEWNETNFDVNMVPYVSEAYKCKKYAFVSDYARFWILYNQGGIYFDTDVEIIKNIDDIIERGNFMGCEQNSTTKYGIETSGHSLRVNPGLGLGVSPGLLLFKEMLDNYSTRHFCINGNMNQKTIVKYTTELLCKYGLKNTNEIQNIADCYIYPKDYFCPYSTDGFDKKFTENTRTIHHYMASWSNQSKFTRYMKLIKYRVLIPLVPKSITDYVVSLKKNKREQLLK